MVAYMDAADQFQWGEGEQIGRSERPTERYGSTGRSMDAGMDAADQFQLGEGEQIGCPRTPKLIRGADGHRDMVSVAYYFQYTIDVTFQSSGSQQAGGFTTSRRFPCSQNHVFDPEEYLVEQGIQRVNGFQ